jgi:hypothetical protein
METHHGAENGRSNEAKEETENGDRTGDVLQQSISEGSGGSSNNVALSQLYLTGAGSLPFNPHHHQLAASSLGGGANEGLTVPSSIAQQYFSYGDMVLNAAAAAQQAGVVGRPTTQHQQHQPPQQQAHNALYSSASHSVFGTTTNPATFLGSQTFALQTAAFAHMLSQAASLQPHQSLMVPAAAAQNAAAGQSTTGPLLVHANLAAAASVGQVLPGLFLPPNNTNPGSFVGIPAGNNINQLTSLPSAASIAATRFVAASAPQAAASVPTSKVLSMDQDTYELSPYQCLVRKQIELFQQPQSLLQSEITTQGRNRPVVPGQVGIRCRHCGTADRKSRSKYAVLFPSQLLSVYQAAQNMANTHLLKTCKLIPEDTRKELVKKRTREKGQKTCKSAYGGGRQYWAETLRVLGVVEGDDRRLRLAVNPPPTVPPPGAAALQWGGGGGSFNTYPGPQHG